MENYQLICVGGAVVYSVFAAFIVLTAVLINRRIPPDGLEIDPDCWPDDD